MLPIADFDAHAAEAAVKAAEKRGSGEIRVCVERQRYGDMDARARQVFDILKMRATKNRNAVLLYVHLRDKQLRILGDEGILAKVPQEFWKEAQDAVQACFDRLEMTVGVVLGVMLISEQQARFFPPAPERDVNELPDGVVRGDAIGDSV